MSVALAVFASLLLLLEAPGSANTTCVVAPEIRNVTINQGLPYRELTAGKDTLVRLFLRVPQCAGNIEMQLTGATIRVSGGAQPHTVEQTVPALKPGDTTYPAVAPFGTLPVDHPGDPILVVPGSVLSRLDGTAFTMSVSVGLTFRWRSSSRDPWIAGTAPGIDRLADGRAMTANVGPASKPLRVLVVPMGDLAQGRDAQFPVAATQAVENGMQTLSRLLPVPAVVNDLVTTSGGLRYRIAPGMLDLGPGPQGLDLMTLDSDGVRRFCGGDHNFTTVTGKLSEHLVAWNSANPAFAADRVIGAVWEGVSRGSPCADGMGSTKTREGWVRAFADRPATATAPAAPSRTGGLLGMEIQHTFGGVDSSAPNYGSNWHSKNFDADGGSQLAYHVTGARYIADDKTVMRYSDTGWDNTNTVMEQPDWERARCVLNPPLPPQKSPCPTGGGIIGAPAAGRGSSIVVAGTTDGTRASAHSYVSEDVQRTPDADGSEYTIVQLHQDGSLLQANPFAVGTVHDHHAGHSNDAAESTTGEFDLTVARHPDAFRFQLRKGTTVLYERAAGDVPEFVGTAPAGPRGAPTPVTEGGGDETLAATSRDGAILAWQEGAGVRVRRRAGGTAAPSALVPAATEPTLNHDGTVLAYVVDGDLYVANVAVPVDPAQPPSVAAGRRIYDRRLQVLADPSASRPSFGGGVHVAVAIDGDLWSIDTTFEPSVGNPLVCRVGAIVTAPCRPLTSTPEVQESNPSWGEDDLLAYERGGAVWTMRTSTVPGSEQLRRIADAGDPTLAQNVLAFRRGDALFAVSATSFTGEVLLVGGAAAAPALSRDGRHLAFDRPVDGQRDVFLLGLAADGDSFVVRHPRPTELRADLWAVSGAGSDPLAVGLRPVAVQGDLATFSLPYDPSSLPPRSTRRVQVSDGWSTAVHDFAQDEGSPKPPETAVYSPAVGEEILQHGAIPLTGSARDATGAELRGSSLRWFHAAPGAPTREVGIGARVSGPDSSTEGFLDPPAGGWTAGRHTVTLRATDAEGLVSEASVEFEIVRDADRDGRPASMDTPCPGAASGGDDDPYDVFADDDRDGILNGEDARPCTADVDVTTDFEPDALYVPSSGTPVTVHFSGPSSLAEVRGSSVVIVQLGQHRLTTPLPAVSWSYDAKKRLGTAKFDRQQLTDAMDRRALVGGWVPVVITGSAPGFTFRGVDPVAPVAFPA